jgi:hypothetical protein
MEELLLLEPREIFNDMIIGVSYEPFAVVYDKDQVVEYWAGEMSKKNPELTESEAYHMALEYLEFNTHRGDHTPIFVSPQDREILLDQISEEST